MAKIYETRQDLEREQLSQAAYQARNEQIDQSMIAGVGASTFLFGFIKKKPVVPEVPEGARFFKRTWHMLRHEPVDFKILGAIIAIAGGIGMWAAGNRAKEAEAELDKLGAETTIFPPMDAPPETECVPCKLKAAQPRSLLEYAAKTADAQQVGK